MVALNCEVFIEWTLANINSSQWGQIIRAASYKSVKQEYCFLSRHHHNRNPKSWNLMMGLLLILLICWDICEINQDNSYSGNCSWLVTWDGCDTRQGESRELYRRDSVKNLFRPCIVATVQRSINHHCTAAEDLNGNWLVFVLRGGYYKWHGNCRSDCLIDWHSPAKTSNFSLVLTFALKVCCPQKCALLCSNPSSLFLLTSWLCSDLNMLLVTKVRQWLWSRNDK